MERLRKTTRIPRKHLFDPTLALKKSFTLAPGSRYFLLDLDAVKKSDIPKVLVST